MANILPCFPGHMDSAHNAYFMDAARVAGTTYLNNRALVGFDFNNSQIPEDDYAAYVCEVGAPRDNRVSAVRLMNSVNLVVNRGRLERFVAEAPLPARVNFTRRPGVGEIGQINDGYHGDAMTTMAMVLANNNDPAIATLNGVNWDVLGETVQVSVTFN